MGGFERKRISLNRVGFTVLGLLLVGVAVLVVQEVAIARARERAVVTVQLLEHGQEKLLENQVEATLKYVAELSSVRRLDPKACRDFQMLWETNRELLPTLAYGDMTGNVLCIADPTVSTPLPSASDRLYFQRVKEQGKFVAGEYVIGKATGKQLVMFAYPVRDAREKQIGFVFAGLDLEVLAKQMDTKVLKESGMRVAWVDQGGKLLMLLPADEKALGSNYLSVEIVNSLLSGKNQSRVTKAYDGKLNVFAYDPVQANADGLYMLVSVPIEFYWIWYVLVLGFGMIFLGYGYLWGTRRGR